jgi:hypothetical protein
MAIKNIAKIKELYNHLKEVNNTKITNNTNLNILGAISQFCQETGYLLKYKANNLAGITCTKSWINSGGKCFDAKTFEDDGTGKTFNTVRGFRYYESTDHFLQDYSRLIKTNYPISAQNSDSVFGYFLGLEKGRIGSFATDTRYFFNLCNMSKLLAPDLLGDSWLKVLVNNYNVLLTRAKSNNWVVNVYKKNHIEKILNLQLSTS